MSPHLRTIAPVVLAACLVASISSAQTTEPQPGPFDQEANYDVALRRLFQVKSTGSFTFFPPATDGQDATDTEDTISFQMGDFAAILMPQSDEETAALMASGEWMGFSFDGFAIWFAIADSIEGPTLEEPATPEEEMPGDEQTEEPATDEPADTQQARADSLPDVTAFGFAFGDFLFGNASVRNDAARAHHCLLVGSLIDAGADAPEQSDAGETGDAGEGGLPIE